MDPLTILALSSAAVKFLKESIPAIRDAFQGGEIPVEKQAEARKQYDLLRAELGNEYTGAEWELSGR